MKTRRLRISRNLPEWKAIEAAARVIGQGGIIAFPTDTTYGLAAGIYCERAVLRLRKIKGRGPDEPFVVIAADTDWVWELAARVSTTHRRLMNAYWPGPLTLVFEASNAVPDYLLGRGRSIAIRIPDDVLTQTVLRACGMPLAAPSANLRSRRPAVSAAEVLASFERMIDLVLDGGAVESSVPSTIVAVGPRGPEILRRGRLVLAEDCA